MSAKKTQVATDIAKEATGPLKATVIKEFRSRDNFNTIHKVGDDVSDLPKEVLQSLLDREMVEISGELDSKEDPAVAYKAEVEELIKDAPDELKEQVNKKFAETTFDGPNHFKSFLEAVKAAIPA